MPNLQGASPVSRGEEGCSGAARSVGKRGSSSCHEVLEDALGNPSGATGRIALVADVVGATVR